MRYDFRRYSAHDGGDKTVSEKTALQKVSEETMRFMRGKYVLDEVGDGIDTLEFRDSGETILTIRIHEDHYEFNIDGKSFLVSDLEKLNFIKQTIMKKKDSNRKPFPKEQAVYSRCGMRCDLCVHYTGGTISDEFREELKKRVGDMYDPESYGEDMMLCPGGLIKDCGDCGKLNCPKSKGLNSCIECADYPCGDCGLVTCGIDANSTSAEDITWAVLPYVDGQYGN